MSLRFMLDTNLCIRVLRDRPPALRSRFNDEAESLAIQTIVLMELLHGAAKSARPVENRRAVEDFASRLAVLPFDDDAAAHAAGIKADLERTGAMIGGYDLLIAGHARSRGLAVVTGNLREFNRVRGLAAEDWTQRAAALAARVAASYLSYGPRRRTDIERPHEPHPHPRPRRARAQPQGR